MEQLLTAFAAIFHPLPFLFCLAGVTVGIAVGAIPGLTGGMFIALCLPLTFFMESTNALILLVSMYVGSTSGGLISATLLRMPGTTAALMTVLDGFPMAQGGRPGRALGFGIYASFIGGMISWVFLAVLSPPLSELAVTFGSYEIFAMVLMALVLISSVSQGTLLKGLLSAAFGVIVALVGVDPSVGQLRLTFGVHQLEPGLRLLPVVLGMFVLSQVIADIVNIERTFEMLQASRRSMFMRFSDMKHQTVNFIRSSLIGTWIGILPGVGSTIASIVSYTMARNLSKTPEKYGTGYEDGIVAAETANNAAVNGALVPLITLGIPGSVIDAILLGAFLIHNITPGPLLFQSNPDLVYGIIAAALLANVLMFVVMLAATPYFAKLMVVPKAFLLPTIVVFCVIGAYATSNLIFDVWVMLAFGVIGYFMQRAGLSIGPFVIGYVLAPIAEVNLRAGLMLYDGSILPMVTRPYALTFLTIAILTLLWPFLRRRPTNTAGGNDP